MTVSDVVVVGAGFAGLSAAHALVGAGLRTIVLEARDRVGGRVLTRVLPDGTQLDLGGQWVGPTQRHMQRLIAEYGLETYPTPEYGRPILDYGGTRPDRRPDEIVALLDRLDDLSRQIFPERPWDHPRAQEWDTLTLAAWLSTQNAPDTAVRYVGRVIAGGLLSCDAGEVSLLDTLFYVTSGGGTTALLDTVGGAQAYRVGSGAQRLAERLAADLPEGTIRLEEPVRRIVHSPTGAHVETDHGVHPARHVIVAIPPSLAGRIDYSPSLPAQRDALTQRMPAGYALKVHAIYAAPFWRDRGLSGLSTSDSGILTETVDNTPPGSPRAVLTAFAYGIDAHALRRHDPAQRRHLVLDRLAELFGEDARAPEDFIEFDWCDEPWTRGCFSAHPTLGTWTAYGPALRPPIGALHWAGTETASTWNGYFDGAVESGLRAAAEIAPDHRH
ncbi:flavin monoamine oxidase family protein [Thermomonospora umbrina]|uniref:Monoamine oxidase n=1 Tax=Thermomonospora umbrina TaxID=111806 RepID=A0A3D9SP95_9ACTN|nr:flavin monoamine oxidase family protein [Thermomonospora umbrina]REE97728.1 monoamine oxidase [Thermomonospora umbrina]